MAGCSPVRRRGSNLMGPDHMAVQDTPRQRGEEPPFLPYPGRLAGALAVIVLPMGVIFGLLAANTDLHPQNALFCWLAISGIAAMVLRQQLQREWGRTVQRAPVIEEQGEAAEDRSEIALQRVLDGLDLPVILFDADRRIGFYNRAVLQLLGPVEAGQDLATLLRNPEVIRAVAEIMRTGQGATVEFRRPVPVNRLLRARLEPVAGGPDDARSRRYMILLDDMTDSERMREVRSDFVADVSHELRTPLASILSIVETLNGAARDDPEAQQRFMSMLDEQATRMARIVDDLLSLSRIEMNEHRPPDDVVEVKRVVGSAVDAALVLAEERGITIDFSCDGEPLVTGDELELTRLFQNLIDNAVKYGAADSVVTVRVNIAEKQVVITVRDRGPGIAIEHIPRLTERFYRVDKGRSRAAGGTGLGLAIVKHVANRHRGRLRVDSVVGEGSTFTVELPLHDR